jgi:hypothetical protein
MRLPCSNREPPLRPNALAGKRQRKAKPVRSAFKGAQWAADYLFGEMSTSPVSESHAVAHSFQNRAEVERSDSCACF